MTNWEDSPIGDSAGNADETPIFTALFLEYREAAFKRLEEQAKQEDSTGEQETPGEDAQQDS